MSQDREGRLLWDQGWEVSIEAINTKLAKYYFVKSMKFKAYSKSKKCFCETTKTIIYLKLDCFSGDFVNWVFWHFLQIGLNSVCNTFQIVKDGMY